MTMLFILIWLAGIITLVKSVLLIFPGVFFLVLAIFCLAVAVEELKVSTVDVLKATKKYITIATVMLSVGLLLPNKTTLYIFAGSVAAKETVEAFEESTIGKKTFMLLEQKLDEQLKEVVLEENNQ